MKQLQITILFIFAVIASVSAKRIEFEYNEFGECVVRRSPSVIETSSDIKQGEDVKPSKKVVSYHPNPITDYLEIEFSKGSYINSRQVELGSDMFYHEFGHTIQSRLLGNSYFPLVAVPSLMGAQLDRWGWHNHDYEWYETFANKHAHHYLKKYEPVDFLSIKNLYTPSTKWDEDRYPLKLHFDWYWLFAHP